MELAKKLIDEATARRKRAGQDFKTSAGLGMTLGLVEVEESGIRMSADLVDLDRYGILLKSVKMDRSGAAPGEKRAAEVVEAQANFLCRKLTYLIESLELVEHDRAIATAIIRSSKTFAGQYYEVQLVGGEKVSMVRYKAIDVDRREKIDFSFTIESFERLTGDLEEALKIK